MKNFWKVLSNILVWLLVTVTVCVMIFTIVSVNTFNRNDRAIFGYRAYVVLSDSMKASGINAGDVVLVKSVDPTTLKSGDVIAYISQNTESYGQTITHMIREKTTNHYGEAGFITYGTTTGVNDETVVTYPFILGRVEITVPMIGTFFQFLKTTQGYIICILIPFLLLIMYQGVNTVKIFRQYKSEQMAELQAEKDAVEAERRRSMEMMEQLQAMQAQLQNQAPAPVAEPAPAAPAQADVDVAAMMAELQALKAQLARQNAAAQPPAEPNLDDVVREFGGQNSEENS